MRCQWLLLGAVLLLGVIDVTSSYKVWTLARANGEFAFCLYNQLIDGDDGMNEFFSPFSVSTALAMTYAGARGKTKQEMRQVLGFYPLNFNIHSAFRATLGSLDAGNSQYTLDLANGVFVDDTFPVRLFYGKLLEKYYSSESKVLDFGEAAKAAKYINDWVEDKTNDNIEDILDQTDLEGAVMALVNAIYFKGCWKYPFDPKCTVNATFHVSPTGIPTVKMMTQTARFRYALNRRLCCEILELPYQGDRLAMYILLPTEKDGLAELESKLTFRSVTSALANLRKRRLSIAIPLFEMTVRKSLPDMLKAMGMKRAFMPADADFSGITPGGGIHISAVIHKAFIGVDEVGTEAAAATVVVFSRGEEPLPPLGMDFVADHPFLFLIRDIVTGSILFLGRLVSPGEP